MYSCKKNVIPEWIIYVYFKKCLPSKACRNQKFPNVIYEKTYKNLVSQK